MKIALDDALMAEIARLATEKDITLEAYVEQILQAEIDKARFQADENALRLLGVQPE